jgi:predicted GIY-YIG superfamily endonuclease
MKKHYVYEIVNLMGTVEYVGETDNIRTRFNSHKGKDGNFYNRQDLIMNVVKEFNTKKEAWWYQVELQIYYGLETDREKNIRAAKRGAMIGGKKPNRILVYSYYTGELIGEYESQNEAGRILNVSSGNVSSVVRGILEQCNGYTFKLK